MGNCLQSSVLWRVMQTIGHALAVCASSSRIFAAVGRMWRGSRTRAWVLRRLDAEPSATQNAAYARTSARLNESCAKSSLKTWWNASLCGRLWHSVCGALQKSRVIGWLFRDGVQGIILCAVGGYVVIDWLLRDALAVPLVSSVWDELLLIFCVFWLIWRRMGRNTPLDVRANPLDLPIALFISVGLLLMCIVSPYPAIQVSGYRATVQYLLWFFVLTRLFESDRDFRRLYLTLCAVALILSLHGIYQYIIGVPMPKNWVAAAETAVRTRVFSIFGSPNIMGDFMVLFVPMTAALAYHTDKKPLQALAWASAIILCVACLFTMSRGAWVAMAVTIVLFISLVDKRLFWLLLAGIVVLMFIPFVRTRIGFLFTEDFVAANTNGGRAGRWENGLALLDSANPLTGFGLGMFGGAVAMQNQVLDGVDYFYMDNYYLKIFVEMGWLGIGSFVFMLLGMCSASMRALRRTAASFKDQAGSMYPLIAGMFSGLVGVLVHCYFENIFEEPYMMVYFWAIAAMIVWAGFLRKPKK